MFIKLYNDTILYKNISKQQMGCDRDGTLREESSQTNVILQYTLLATILNAVCSVIQQS